MTKPTFINLDIEKPIHWKFLTKHIIYSLTWILSIWIIIFRGDYFLLKILPANLDWIVKIVPFTLIGLILVFMIKSKWYYNLSLIFYPLLLIFWFIPKTVLQKGKIYLLSGYVNFIYNRFKRFKSTLIHSSITILAILLLIVTDSDIVRICSMLYFSVFYYKVVIKYIRQSLQPVKLFGANVEKSLDELIKQPEKSYSIIKSFEETKGDEKLLEDELKLKRVERLIIANTLIEYLGANLSGFKGKRAFVISWIYQLIGFVIITVTYFTFINFELFIVDNSSFKVTSDPTLFDFFYYTVKTFIFSNIELILPVGVLARIIEIISFLTVGVFILIIVTSVIFSLRQDRINANIQKATEVCLAQNRFIAQHIKLKYQMDIETVLIEASSIRNSIENIKRTIEKIL
ncbi:MAG TPA: hypothetical protein DER09_09015 [Prolixibacteraceae bacterium]|nr:hypothetical protein [Prolixibacteraceae bacterium]